MSIDIIWFCFLQFKVLELKTIYCISNLSDKDLFSGAEDEEDKEVSKIMASFSAKQKWA